MAKIIAALFISFLAGLAAGGMTYIASDSFCKALIVAYITLIVLFVLCLHLAGKKETSNETPKT